MGRSTILTESIKRKEEERSGSGSGSKEGEEMWEGTLAEGS